MENKISTKKEGTINLKITWGKAATLSVLLIGLYIAIISFAYQPAKANYVPQSDEPGFTGRMTGGGVVACRRRGSGGAIVVKENMGYYAKDNDEEDNNIILVHHGFELYCDPNDRPNNIQINFKIDKLKGVFHLESVFDAFCDNTDRDPENPAAEIDSLTLTGAGRFNGKSGANITVTLTDAGEPGKNDTATFLIIDADGNRVLNCTGNLKGGNHQAHELQPNRK